ncbi:hypothetical protein DDB_G0289377 [Dictyostelium discoideum AX4]|uniref:Uncharacterized protein n=1 Tax=Dictyostelium discoideum TaxID=44689 RepID=Q54HP0_DICDI|nr:hypothetical protein DDB_G0289377 [Dictyostelium discoideum AX4]EAL62775.1 hypothetical protein DDB_G0289377 [Dictyostelium discoideum AX4]|eukprot:XP_636261.1 hypothetical protein DDB_G0289377 [Dictyostelium discoideum AX4]
MLDHFPKSLDINLKWRVKHIDTTKDEKLIKVTSYNGQVVQSQQCCRGCATTNLKRWSFFIFF